MKRRSDDAAAMERHFDEHGIAVGRQRSLHLDEQRTRRILERPMLSAGIKINEAIVLAKVLRGFRSAELAKIGRRRADHMSNRAEIVTDHAGQRWLLAAHDDVMRIVGQNGALRRDGEVNANAGTALGKLDGERRENKPGVIASGLNAQCAERPDVDVPSLRDVIIEIGQHPGALPQQPLASFRQDDTMRRAADEAKAQRLLQLLHALADD